MNVVNQRRVRFLVGGGTNTAFTYGVYLLLRLVLQYQVAYLIAYCCGVVFAYWFNAVYVFKVPLSWKGALSYPFVYVAQYGASALLLELLIKYAKISSTFAPLIVTACMVPLTYGLSKVLLEWSSRHKIKEPSDARD